MKPNAGRWWWMLLPMLICLPPHGLADDVSALPLAAAAPAPRVSLNRVQPLYTGRDALAARLDLVEHAEQSVDFQYYIFHADNAGKLLADALLRAADRGVKVRGLVDDMHGSDNRLLKALNAHPNIEIRHYNPFYLEQAHFLELLLDLGHVDRRMHNKQLTVDGRYSIVGGRNVGDEYFGGNQDLAFTDLDVLVAGPAVAELERIFADYWTAPYSKQRGRSLDPDKVRDLRLKLADWAEDERSPLLADLYRSAYMQAREEGQLLTQACPTSVLADSPGKVASPRPDSEIARQLSRHLQEARGDVLLVASYFVPGENGADILEAVAGRQVNVEVLTNSLASTDVAAVHAGYKRYRSDLLKAGVGLWEMKPQRLPRHWPHFSLGSSRASLHTKAYFFDRRYLFVGSFNLDPRSRSLNTEMGLLFDCPALAGSMREALGAVLPDLAYRVYLNGDDALRWEDRSPERTRIYTGEPHAGLWRRFLVWCLQWLPIESQL